MALSGSLNFITASEIGLYRVNPSSVRYGITRQGALAAGSAGFTPVDFAGLNTIIYENLTGSSNTLGSTDVSYTLGSDIFNLDIVRDDSAFLGNSGEVSSLEASKFNSLMLHRNGPYQHPSWKQIRGGEHPVARHLRLNNTMSVETNNPRPTDLPSHYKFEDGNLYWDKTNGDYKAQREIEAYNGQGYNSKYEPHPGKKIGKSKLWAKKITNNSDLLHFYEPVIISKYKPFRYNIDVGDKTAVGVQSLTNQMHFFTNDKLNARLRLSSGNPSTSSANNIYTKRKQQYYKLFHSAKSAGASNFIYSERLFPREINAYRAFKLQRPNYEEVAGDGHNGYDRQWGEQRFFWTSTQGSPAKNAVSNGTTRLRTDLTARNSLNLIQETQYKDNTGLTATYANLSGSANSGRTIFATSSEGGTGFNYTGSYIIDGIVTNGVNSLTGGLTQAGDGRTTVDSRPSASFVQHRLYQPLPLSALSVWPLDPAPGVYNPGRVHTSSIGGQGTMIGLTPHDLGSAISGDSQKVVLSDTTAVFLQNAIENLLTGAAGELVYSTKPTIFFNRNNTQTADSGGYGKVIASAQYHRHTYPYNSPFYATDKIRGDVPNYDTYSEFSNLIKESGRDFAIVPEFNMSEHADFYNRRYLLGALRDVQIYTQREVKQQSATNTSFKNLFLPQRLSQYINEVQTAGRGTNLRFLSLHGADLTQSAPGTFTTFDEYSQNLGNGDYGPLLRYDDLSGTYTYKDEFSAHVDQVADVVKFNQKYSHTDKLDNFSHLMVQKQGFSSNEQTIPSQITIRCSAVKKGRIKNGFFPVTRTLQIVKDFEKSIFGIENPQDKPAGYAPLHNRKSANTLFNNDALAKQALIEPLFAPGVLYNSIKSGIAVDWPIYQSPAEGGDRPPIYYTPQAFVSASTAHTYITRPPHSPNRVRHVASSSFNYGGFQMLGASRCIPAIINNIPSSRLPFKALYDYSALERALPKKTKLYIPTDFIDLDRVYVFSSGTTDLSHDDVRYTSNSTLASTYSLPFLTNSAHPGYSIPTRDPGETFDPALNPAAVNILNSVRHPAVEIRQRFQQNFDNYSVYYLYFSSINNYLAETMNFFLADVEDDTAGVKLPVIMPENLRKGADQQEAGVKFDNDLTKPYYMTVKLSMGIDQVNAEGPRRSGMPRETADIFAGSSMRGYLYGPPIEVAPHREPTFEEIRDTKYYPYGAPSSSFTPVPGTKEIIRDIGVLAKPSSGAFHPNAFWDYQSYFNLNLQDPAYQAYTPPYFYGDSNYVLKFIPEDSPVGGGTNFTFEDVWSFSTSDGASYFDQYNTGSAERFNTGSSDLAALCPFMPATGSVSAGSFSRMKIDASIEFSQPFSVTDVTNKDNTFSTAYIAPWWTCPVLDFSSSYSAIINSATSDGVTSADGEFIGRGSPIYSVIENTHHDHTTGRGLWGGYGTDPYDQLAMEKANPTSAEVTKIRLRQPGLTITPTGRSERSDSTTGKGIYLSVHDNFAGRILATSPAQIKENDDASVPTQVEIDGFFSDATSTAFGASVEKTGSLAEKLGFSSRRYEIGKISQRGKTLSEAVIVIPYLEEPLQIIPKKVTFSSGVDVGTQLPAFARADQVEVTVTGDTDFGQVFPGDEVYATREIIPGKHFLPIHRSLFQNALSMIMAKKYLPEDQQADIYGLQDFTDEAFSALLTSDVGKMIDKLTGYSQGNGAFKQAATEFQLPPEFDFVHNSSVDPFQMIVLPFNHQFDHQDLVDIYQNINPKITKTIETDIKEAVLNTSGIEGLEQATWMPKVYTESLQFVKDLAFSEELARLLSTSQNTSILTPAQLESYKALARASTESLSYEDVSSVSLAGHGFESFLYPPTKIIEENSVLKEFVEPSIGIDPNDDNSIKTSKDFYSKLKFMVFKVKQKGIKNYDQYRKKQIAAAVNTRFERGTNFVAEGTEVLNSLTYSEVYGANWPYDYFSLIETIKVDIEIKVDE